MPVTLVRKIITDPVQQAAERLHGRLRNAYLEAVAALQAGVGVQELADALGRGDYEAAVRILGVDANFARVLEGTGVERSFRDAVQEAYRAGAVAAHRSLPSDVSLQLSFDLLNPRAVDFIRGYSFSLIHDISHDARESIRNVLVRAFQEGGHPFQQARQIRNSIGLNTRQERAVANYRNALENNSMSALQRQLRDRRFDPSVAGAVAAGAPLPQSRIDQLVQRYRERYLNHRAETIARTETNRAANHGRREVWRQAEEQKLLEPQTTERVWIASGDADTCPDCAALDGTSVALDDEFDEGDPPIHPNCRCTTALQFDTQKRDRVAKAGLRHGHWQVRERVWVWKYSEDQPRVPAGQPGGGEFAGAGAGRAAETPEKPPEAKPYDIASQFGNAVSHSEDVEADNKGTQLAAEWRSRLTFQEKAAIDEYRGTGFRPINNQLRGRETPGYSPQMVQKWTEGIDSALGKASLPESVVVYRGFNAGATEQRVRQLHAGDTFTDKGFTSTSLSRYTPLNSFTGFQPAGAGEVSVTMARIEVPAGSHAQYVASHQGEAELLVGRGAKYEVLGESTEHLQVKFFEGFPPDSYTVHMVNMRLVGTALAKLLRKGASMAKPRADKYIWDLDDIEIEPAVHKFSPDEPRDERGRWTEGAADPTGLRFHGTSDKAAKSILKTGLRLKNSRSYVYDEKRSKDVKAIFAARQKENAIAYGANLAYEKGSETFTVLGIDGSVFTHVQGATTEDIPPSAIRSVEVYRTSDVPRHEMNRGILGEKANITAQPIRSLVRKSADVRWVAVVGDEVADLSSPTVEKYSEDQPRVPAGSPAGGEFAGAGAGAGAGGGTSASRKSKGSLDQKGPKLSESPPEAQNQALKQAGIFLGSGINEKEMEDRFGMDVVTLKNTLLAGVPHSEGTTMRLTYARGYGGGAKDVVRLTFTGPSVEGQAGSAWSASRILMFNTGIVDHAFFEIAPEFQHTGIAKQFLANSMDLYDHLGMKTIEVMANIDRGGYAWVKYGFVPSQDSWDEHRGEWRYQSNPAIAPPGRSLGEAAREALQNKDPRGIRIVAADPDGKSFLSGVNWEGALNLDDKESYGIFRAYVGR